MYISRGFIYLVEIWFVIAKSAVIIVVVFMGMGWEFPFPWDSHVNRSSVGLLFGNGNSFNGNGNSIFYR